MRQVFDQFRSDRKEDVALIVGFNPPAGYVYFPSVIEILTSVGLLALEVVGFIYIVKRFPILPPRKKTLRPGEVQLA